MEKTDNGLKFTESEIGFIMHEGGVWGGDDEIIFETVSEKIIDFDTEKSSANVKYTIKEVATGKKYTAVLGQSPWYLQGEHNAKQIWMLN